MSTPNKPPAKLLHQGRYLNLVERDGWEFAARRHPAAAVLVAWTDDGELLVVEQFRIPVARRTIELPAGLVGDLEGRESEDLMTAAARELEEETGYRAGRLVEILRCPTSPGMTDEVAVFIRAFDLVEVGAGGGDATEDITVHRLALDEADDWLFEQHAAGKAVDPKIFAALHWMRRERAGQSSN